MDPNETLRMIRTYVSRLNEVGDAMDRGDEAMFKRLTATESPLEMASALAEYVEALDEWLTAGGFLPREWLNTGRG